MQGFTSRSTLLNQAFFVVSENSQNGLGSVVIYKKGDFKGIGFTKWDFYKVFSSKQS